jgi:hypothetical protein
MCDTISESIQAKKTLAAIPWDERVSLHKVCSFGLFTIPLKKYSSVLYGQCQINLKVVLARMDIQILFPLFLANVTLDKKTHHNIRCVYHPVQCPAEILWWYRFVWIDVE